MQHLQTAFFVQPKTQMMSNLKIEFLNLRVWNQLFLDGLAKHFTTMVQTEMSQQLSNGSPQNFVQTFTVPRGWILLVIIPTFLVSRPWGWHLNTLQDTLWWILGQTHMFPNRMNCNDWRWGHLLFASGAIICSTFWFIKFFSLRPNTCNIPISLGCLMLMITW